jgi:hypothetical protein
MPVLTCPRCVPIVVPDELTPELKRQAADTVRGGSGAVAMKLLHDHAAMSLHDAKALVLHLARRPGHCQRCDASLQVAELAYCSRCRALTITW